jgi:tRNA dimethylallyltransferase
LLYGLDEMPKADKTLRKELKTKSQDELYSVLLKSDPEAAEKNKKNPQRLLRALEVNILSGKTIQEHFKPKSPRYDFEHYSISVDNKILYKKINERCKYMIENGMIDETQKVLNMGFDKKCPALSGIGYRHIMQYLEKKISKENLILEFSKDTRHYAKRQNAWFKSQSDVNFVQENLPY